MHTLVSVLAFVALLLAAITGAVFVNRLIQNRWFRKDGLKELGQVLAPLGILASIGGLVGGYFIESSILKALVGILVGALFPAIGLTLLLGVFFVFKLVGAFANAVAGFADKISKPREKQ
jgi:hypothetical protein